jgi:hypothetical protein
VKVVPPAGANGAGPRTRQTVNRVLRRYTGYELRSIKPAPARAVEKAPKAPAPATVAAAVDRAREVDRLVEKPAFVLSCVRSGSTLLRLMLDSHPQICAPHEMHLRRFTVDVSGTGRESMKEMGIDEHEVRNLLWDRLLHHELTRSGKPIFVNKTPNDALIWADILACWPKARFVYLRRHPGAIVESWAKRRKRFTHDQVVSDVLAYATGMNQAEAAVGGLVVRYEDLTREPERETRRLAEFLGVDWDPAMVDYAGAEHRGVRRGLGDWSETVQSGVIRPVGEQSDLAVPEPLRPIAESWGYL